MQWQKWRSGKRRQSGRGGGQSQSVLGEWQGEVMEGNIVSCCPLSFPFSRFTLTDPPHFPIPKAPLCPSLFSSWKSASLSWCLNFPLFHLDLVELCKDIQNDIIKFGRKYYSDFSEVTVRLMLIFLLIPLIVGDSGRVEEAELFSIIGGKDTFSSPLFTFTFSSHTFTFSFPTFTSIFLTLNFWLSSKHMAFLNFVEAVSALILI